MNLARLPLLYPANDRYEIWTRVTTVKGWCLGHLTNRSKTRGRLWHQSTPAVTQFKSLLFTSKQPRIISQTGYAGLNGCFRSWGREELNLQCLPLKNWFTVSRNTANRCRFPITAARRLAIMFFVPCIALSCFVLTMIQQEYPSLLLLNEVLMLPFRGLDASAPHYNCPWYHTAKT